MKLDTTDILLFINFFLLAIAILALHYYAYRLRHVLRRSEELRKEAENYQKLFNTTWDGVFQTDEEWRLISINRAGAQILGYTNPESLLESEAKTFCSFLNSEHCDTVCQDILCEGFLQNCLIEFTQKGGHPGFLELTANVYRDEEGGLAGFEGIFRDVTRRVRAEQELRNYSENLEKLVLDKTQEILTLERKKLQLESLASLGQMVATIVHEIRNPLSSIKIGLTTLLKRSPLEERDRHCLELATLEVGNLERILQDLLNFSKPLEIHSVAQDVNVVLDLALVQMTEDLTQAGITVKREMPSDLPRIQVDSGRLQQVFFNILINAKEAMQKGGTITVRTTEIPDERIVCVDVTDEGQGIDKETLDHIFEPFYSTKEKGSGLGLTVVQKIIEAHGGTIGIESQKGKGTTVRMEFPYDEMNPKKTDGE